jgi:hypothetical protein
MEKWTEKLEKPHDFTDSGQPSFRKLLRHKPLKMAPQASAKPEISGNSL